MDTISEISIACKLVCERSCLGICGHRGYLPREARPQRDKATTRHAPIVAFAPVVDAPVAPTGTRPPKSPIHLGQMATNRPKPHRALSRPRLAAGPGLAWAGDGYAFCLMFPAYNYWPLAQG